jgi:hypothetical protein
VTYKKPIVNRFYVAWISLSSFGTMMGDSKTVAASGPRCLRAFVNPGALAALVGRALGDQRISADFDRRVGQAPADYFR